MAFVKVPDITSVSHQADFLQIEWNELKFSITSAKEAVLSAKLIKELRSILPHSLISASTLAVVKTG